MASIKTIEKLLEKYENAETTLQEEQQLKNYFTEETVAPHLEVYKPMFAYFLHTQNETFTKDIPLKPKKTTVLYQWISVAAIVIIMLGVVFNQASGPDTIDDLTQEELLAYNQAMDAFQLLSSNFNKGTESIDVMSHVSESFDKGTDNMALLGQFDNSLNKVFKTNE